MNVTARLTLGKRTPSLSYSAKVKFCEESVQIDRRKVKKGTEPSMYVTAFQTKLHSCVVSGVANFSSSGILPISWFDSRTTGV